MNISYQLPDVFGLEQTGGCFSPNIVSFFLHRSFISLHYLENTEKLGPFCCTVSVVCVCVCECCCGLLCRWSVSGLEGFFKKV